MRAAHSLAAIAAACWLSACSGSLIRNKTEQGLAGAFSLYSAPLQLIDCSTFSGYEDIDACKRENHRVLDEPLRATIRIRNLSSGDIVDQPLDEQGAYRVVLVPGQYEVCLEGECSDPLVVRMGSFGVYGQRLPKPAVEQAERDSLDGDSAKAPAAASIADSLKF